MNKLFRPKCLRRVLLCLALLFPIVYLCGGLFFALAGAHGENVLASEETSIVDYKNLDFNQLKENGDFKNSLTYNAVNFNQISYNGFFYGNKIGNASCSLDFNAFISFIVPNHKYLIRFNAKISTLNNTATSVIRGSGNGTEEYFGNWVFTNTYSRYETLFSFTRNDFTTCGFIFGWNQYIPVDTGIYVKDLNIFDLSQMYGIGNEPTLAEFDEVFTDDYYPYTLSEFYSLPIYGVPNEQNSLFFHIFSQRNFISQLGKNLIDGSTKGFAPMNDLFRFINSNMLHFESTDGLAMFGLGYIYYAVNVLIIYEILILAVKLIMLPLKAVDLFDKKEDI